MKDSDPERWQTEEVSPTIASFVSFQALVSGTETEAEPNEHPELTWSRESGETSETTIHSTKVQKKERYMERTTEICRMSPLNT